MKIKKQCGYLDQKGGFHKNLFECNNANIEYRIRKLQNSIESLVTSYSLRFYKKLDVDMSNCSEIIERVIKELMVNQRDHLIEYGKEIDSIQTECEKLKFKGTLPKYLRKDWWMGRSLGF